MPIREDLLNPIPGANPSGESLRYAPVYDQIKEARREEAEVAQGEWRSEIKKADWVQVVKLASDALSKKSKDLQIAAWLTEAVTRREGYGGLKAGLDLMRGLIESFWDTLYPEIEDGDVEMRATPLEWVGSRMDETVKRVPLTRGGLDWFSYKESRTVPTEAEAADSDVKQQARATAVEEHKLTPEEFDGDFKSTPKAVYQQFKSDLDGCLESLGSLNTICEERFGDSSPNLTGLRKTLEEVRQTIQILLAKKREQEPDEGEEPAPVTGSEEESAVSEPSYAAYGAATAPARAPIPKTARRALTAEPADRDDAGERIAAVAHWLRTQDASNPAPYLLVRGLRWGELRAAGEGYDPDASLLEAPSTETRQQLKKMAGDGEWQQVLDIAEAAAAAPCGRAWLDLQRYAATAADNLGYYAVSWAIKSGLKSLVADLPNLLEMTLVDDTPTANAETRAWLREFTGTSAAAARDYYAQAPSPRASEEEPAETEAPPDAFEMAIEAARGGRVQEAIEILSREAAQEFSGRGRFQRRVQLAQVCLGAGREAIARPILEELAREIEQRRLEDWEAPDTVAHALALLYRCMERMETTAEEKQKIYGRICRLDPVQALSISR